MNARRIRLGLVGGLLLLLADTAFLLGDGRLSWKRPEPKPWPTFVVPDGGFSVHFPTATPAEVSLTGHLIDPDGPTADKLLGLLRSFQAAGGAIRSWSAEDGPTRYSIRIQVPPASQKPVPEAFHQLAESEKKLAPSVTNLPVAEERKTVVGELKGRYFLVTRPNGSRVLTYLFFIQNRAVLLFAERTGDSLTMEDPAARRFFRSVEVTTN